MPIASFVSQQAAPDSCALDKQLLVVFLSYSFTFIVSLWLSRLIQSRQEANKGTKVDDVRSVPLQNVLWSIGIRNVSNPGYVVYIIYACTTSQKLNDEPVTTLFIAMCIQLTEKQSYNYYGMIKFTPNNTSYGLVYVKIIHRSSYLISYPEYTLDSGAATS